MGIYRSEQNLDSELDVTFEEYKEVGNLRYDYRYELSTSPNFWATCDYDFLKNLNVGNVLFLTNEDTGNLSPLVHSIELDDDNYKIKLLRVTRKIYSPTGLDVYVVETTDNHDLNF